MNILILLLFIIIIKLFEILVRYAHSSSADGKSNDENISQDDVYFVTPAENRIQGGMKQIVERGLNLSGS